MNKMKLLRELNIGHGVAEQETENLASYFIKTDQWNKVVRGDIDIVYGQKGAGKSALFSYLCDKEYDLIDDNVLIIPACNMRGESIFSVLKEICPSENSFIYLWKLYVLVLIASKMREFKISNEKSLKLQTVLEEANLLPKIGTIKNIFSSVKSLISNKLFRKTTETTLRIELNEDGMPAISRSSKYDNSAEEKTIPVSDLLEIANSALQESDIFAWVIFDRLDVAFSETEQLEENALRALFRVYLDLLAYSNIKLKIFVRDDIWDRIVKKGFREASHIVKKTTIFWDSEGLLKLLFSRILNNENFVEAYKLTKENVLSSSELQREIFYRIAPDKVSTGKNPETFDWIVSRIADGKKISTPRDIVCFFNELKQKQIEVVEKGGPEPPSEKLFDRQIFKKALKAVSETRYHQTLLAENPDLRQVIEALREKKAEQNINSLAQIWDRLIETDKVQFFADRLCDVGFFEKRTSGSSITYWVPFLYRDALHMVQGKSFSEDE